MIEQQEVRAMLATALEPLEWIAAAVIDPALASLPPCAIRHRVEEAVEVFRQKLRGLPAAVAASAPYASEAAAAEALDIAMKDALAAAHAAVKLCDQIGTAIYARSATRSAH